MSRSAHLHDSPKLTLSSYSSSYSDPHISLEDEELRRLERLLKVAKPGGRQMLRKELGELDGLGEVYIYIYICVCVCVRVCISVELGVSELLWYDVKSGTLLY